MVYYNFIVFRLAFLFLFSDPMIVQPIFKRLFSWKFQSIKIKICTTSTKQRNKAKLKVICDKSKESTEPFTKAPLTLILWFPSENSSSLSDKYAQPILRKSLNLISVFYIVSSHWSSN